jgi:hypothetical protein
MGGKIEWVQLGAEASRRKCAADDVVMLWQ